MRNRVVLIVAAVVLAAAGVAFTKPGRVVLAQFGLAKACNGDGCGE